MTVVVDAAPIVAAADPSEPLCKAIRAVMIEEPRLIIPAPVTAEVDYLLRRRVGVAAARAFLDDIARGRLEVVGLSADEHESVRRLDEQYADLGLGLADASVVVLAHRFQTTRLLTLDQRHFRAVRAITGEPFVLLPSDVQR